MVGKLVVLGTHLVRASEDDVLYVVDYPVTYSAPADKDVGASTTEILAENADRKVAVVVNDSDTTVYLAVGADAEVNKGIRLNANGGSAQFGGPGGLPLTTQAINGIHGGAGTKVVTAQEAE